MRIMRVALICVTLILDKEDILIVCAEDVFSESDCEAKIEDKKFLKID